MATADKFTIFTEGTLSVVGRLVDASNATLYAEVAFADEVKTCIYKPIAGERPLWDFSDGCLAHREYAAYLVSEFLGLHIVPFTILREGPYGLGMVQEWIEIDESIDLAQYFSSDDSQLRSMVLFDAIINNTDRKIGHLIPTESGVLFGCDHGVTFHVEDKLRTVLWQWAGEPLEENELLILHKMIEGLSSQLLQQLSPLLTHDEIEATRQRVNTLLENQTMPVPNPNWPSIPWPAF